MSWLDDFSGLASLFGEDAGNLLADEAAGDLGGLFLDTATGEVVDQSFIDALIQGGNLSLTSGAQDAGTAGDILFASTNAANTDVPFTLGVTGIDGQPINPGGVMFDPSTLTPGGQNLGFGSGGTSFGSTSGGRLSNPLSGGNGSGGNSSAFNMPTFDLGGGVSAPQPPRPGAINVQGPVDAGPNPVAFNPMQFGGTTGAQQVGLERLMAGQRQGGEADPFKETRSQLEEDALRRGLSRLLGQEA